MPQPKKYRWWLGPLVSLLTLLLLGLALELALRWWLDDERQQALPHFGLSEDLQMRYAWHDWQARRGEYGTTSYPSSFDQLDPQLGWRVKPDVSARHVKPGAYEVTVTTNSFSLRGEHPTDLQKPPTLTRIGIFGDSQTFGETVNDEQTYVAVLNQLQPDNEFLNFGVRGYGTDQMLLYYEAEAAQFELDVVVLGFAFFHLERNARGFLFFAKPYFELDGEALTLRGTPVPSREQLLAEDLGAELWPVLEHSALARWIWQRLRNLQARQIYAEDGATWQLSAALIERFAERAKAAGSEVVVLSIDDSKPELEDDLQALTDRLGVGLVNMGPILRRAGAEGIDYTLPNDNHWNARGNAMVAQTLDEYLCSRELIRCR